MLREIAEHSGPAFQDPPFGFIRFAGGDCINPKKMGDLVHVGNAPPRQEGSEDGQGPPSLLPGRRQVEGRLQYAACCFPSRQVSELIVPHCEGKQEMVQSLIEHSGAIAS